LSFIPRLSFIQWIALACVGAGVAVMLGGIVLAFMESRTYPKLSEGVTSLSDIASKLVARQGASDLTRDAARTLGDAAQAFREVVRVARGPAKSAPALRIGLVLVVVGVILTIIDYTVDGKESGSSPAPATVPSTSTSTTTTKP
jgi:hypothetical protein